MRDTRSIIEEEVKSNIGITFSELKKRTGLANGVLQHHINNSDKIVKKKKALIPKDYCEEECNFEKGCGEICIHNILRDELKKTILRKLQSGKKQVDVAEELGLHKATISYHVKKLKEAGLK